MTRVAVITGGSTPERAVALAGAGQVMAALRERGYDVVAVDTCAGVLTPAEETRLLEREVGREPPTETELLELRERELGPRLADLEEVRTSDLLFLLLHGRQGEGGELQALLDMCGLPYTGSTLLGSAVAMDKITAKRLFRSAGIPTAEWAVWPTDEETGAALGYPLIVKPSNVGSTVGLSLAQSWEEVVEGARQAARFDVDILLEEFLEGREFTVGVLGTQALGVGEIITPHGIFDYESKYTPGVATEVFPARIDPGLARRLQELAVRVHEVLRLRDFSRVDFRLDRTGEPSCLEANTLPGMTSTSLLPQSAAVTGIDFPELCHRICQLALARVGA